MLTKVNPPRRPQFCTIEIFYSPELDGCLILFTVIPRKFLPSSLLVSRRPLGSWHSPPSGHGKQLPDYIGAKVPLKDPLRFWSLSLFPPGKLVSASLPPLSLFLSSLPTSFLNKLHTQTLPGTFCHPPVLTYHGSHQRSPLGCDITPSP